MQPPMQRHVQPLPRPPAPPQVPQRTQYFSQPNMTRPPMMNPRHPVGPMVPQPPMVSQGMQPHPIGMPRQPHMHQMMQPAPMMSVAAGPVPMPTYPMPMAGPSMPQQVGVPPTITPAEQKEWESAYKHNEGDGEKKKGKEKKYVRVAGTQVWEDSSLSSWDPSKALFYIAHLLHIDILSNCYSPETDQVLLFVTDTITTGRNVDCYLLIATYNC